MTSTAILNALTQAAPTPLPTKRLVTLTQLTKTVINRELYRMKAAGTVESVLQGQCPYWSVVIQAPEPEPEADTASELTTKRRKLVISTVSCTKEEVELLAAELFSEYGTSGTWKLVWDTCRSRAGQCRYSTKTISVSSERIKTSPLSDLRETLLHEIAHALTPGHRHGPIWQAQLVSMGGTGNRNCDQRVGYKFLVGCPDGHWEAMRNKVSKR